MTIGGVHPGAKVRQRAVPAWLAGTAKPLVRRLQLSAFVAGLFTGVLLIGQSLAIQDDGEGGRGATSIQTSDDVLFELGGDLGDRVTGTEAVSQVTWSTGSAEMPSRLPSRKALVDDAPLAQPRLSFEERVLRSAANPTSGLSPVVGTSALEKQASTANPSKTVPSPERDAIGENAPAPSGDAQKPGPVEIAARLPRLPYAGPSQPVLEDRVAPPPEPDPIPALEPPIKQQGSLLEGNTEIYVDALTSTSRDALVSDPRVNRLLTNPPSTEGSALAFRDVLVYTLSNNPEISAAYWRTEDARFAVRAAQSSLLPQVELGGGSGVEATHVEAQPRVNILQRTEATVRVSQRLFDFGRARGSVRRARALQNSRQLEKRDIVEDIVLSAVTAYLDLLGSMQLVETSRENVAAHERIVALVQKNFDAGNISEAELKRAITRLDRARTNAIDFENRLDLARNTFRRVTGLEPGRLAEPMIDVSAAYDLNRDTVDAFLQSNPSMQAVIEEIKSIEEQLKVTSRTNLPQIDLQLAGSYRENLLGNEAWTSDARAMITANWSAYDGGNTGARRGQLIARQRETEQLLIQLRNELRQDAFNIVSVLTTTEDKRGIFTEQVESSKRVVELYAKQFDAGRRSLLDLLDAQADLARAQEESIATKYENLAAALGSIRLQNKLTETLATQFDLPRSLVTD